jgi:hypothetical protein
MFPIKAKPKTATRAANIPVASPAIPVELISALVAFRVAFGAAKSSLSDSFSFP